MKLISDIKTLQAIELDIMSYIDRVCRDNGLKYFLAYGTLIGAVRHGGFIPWDDDIDILMPRDDYRKLCRIVRAEKKRYRIVEHIHTAGYRYGFAKVFDSHTKLEENVRRGGKGMGVYVDVFPYDGYPGSVRLRMINILGKLRHWEMRGFHSMKSEEHPWKNVFRYILYGCIRIVGYKPLLALSQKLACARTVEQSELVGCFSGFMDNEKEVFHRVSVERLKDAEFEGRMFLIPEGYDELLRNMYGDYMKLPPESERVSNHDFKAWIDEKEKP